MAMKLRKTLGTCCALLVAGAMFIGATPAMAAETATPPPFNPLTHKTMQA